MGAASAISAGNTWPGWPVLGVTTQITPSSASGPIASIRVSTKSPSPSRHHNRTTSMTSSVSSSSNSPPHASSMAARMSSSVSSSQPHSWISWSRWMPNLRA
ncbi:Uncharacterised protein [Mycobacterium tuberculosis]|nr:Uncharacterised protein [Mycobacterium tuberculosis]